MWSLLSQLVVYLAYCLSCISLSCPFISSSSKHVWITRGLSWIFGLDSVSNWSVDDATDVAYFVVSVNIFLEAIGVKIKDWFIIFSFCFLFLFMFSSWFSPYSYPYLKILFFYQWNLGLKKLAWCERFWYTQQRQLELTISQ